MMEPILALHDLAVSFRVRHGLRHRLLKALKPTTMEIRRAETLAVVGESGSGKTTLGRAILRLIEISGGRILYQDQDLASLSTRQMRRLRPRFQMVFQDPYSSLNPGRKIQDILSDVFGKVDVPKAEHAARTAALLADVGLEKSALNRYPAAFSGGQRQRIAIARAIATKPELLVADEPTSALDVSIQAQIINLLLNLKRERQLTLLLISHDLGLVSKIADRIAVMYFGEIVEIANASSLTASPAHPYSCILQASRLRPEVHSARKTIETASRTPNADLPSLLDPQLGCPFRRRCSRALDICAAKAPRLAPIRSGRMVACHNPALPPDTESKPGELS